METMRSSLFTPTRRGLTDDWVDEWGLSNNTVINWLVDHDEVICDSYDDDGIDYSNCTGKLQRASDVNVHGVLIAVVLNAGIFVACIILYEVLRRVMPAVYKGNQLDARRRRMSLDKMLDMPFPFWVIGVVKIPWIKVRENAGLDAYMFLRYIRMCLRITTVSAFWGIVILWPVFVTGGGGASGWYHFSMANVDQGNWRIWVPCFYMWLTTLYIIWVIQEEYKHYLDLRTDFLGRGELSKRVVNDQHHYSIVIESIPRELRSDHALFEYFDGLFPGKVHSACVVLNLPDLEVLKGRRERVCRRLEKATAFLEATGERKTHVVGRPMIMLAGVETEVCLPRCSCCCCAKKRREWNEMSMIPPERGEEVDSILYYSSELADMNEKMLALQKEKEFLAEKGNEELHASNWVNRAFRAATAAAATVVASKKDAEQPDVTTEENLASSTREMPTNRDDSQQSIPSVDRRGIFASSSSISASTKSGSGINDSTSSHRLIEDNFLDDAIFYDADPSDPTKEHKSRGYLEAFIGSIGVDFAANMCSGFNRNIDVIFDNVVGKTMSATGFVTFHDLCSVTTAASAPLTNTPEVLNVAVAPEPRDIIWQNAHIEKKFSAGRELTANILIGLGAILWSIPLAAIQAFATADSLARIPGMGWTLSLGGQFTNFVNGYLPVVALLGLILILPLLFEWVGTNFEHRKTHSDVQHSIVGRYFYYQLANIYISVTAGSLWNSLADIIDHPSNIFEVLGKSLPTVVGYFISLLITKILAGLPMVMLRFGPLSKMLFYKMFFREERLTQRELGEVYKDQAIFYGWEYPTQLLVIVICFTYASISPIILPVGTLYFLGAMIVYKKQVLYVYTPTYESGGILFPAACDRTLFGLIGGQLTLMGYCLLRQGGRYKFGFLLPLPFYTFYKMRKFWSTYFDSGMRLSVERAMDIDITTSNVGKHFDKYFYRQPVLAEKALLPLPYRRLKRDKASRSINFAV